MIIRIIFIYNLYMMMTLTIIIVYVISNHNLGDDNTQYKVAVIVCGEFGLLLIFIKEYCNV